MMEPDARLLALSFSGMFCGAFAALVALLSSGGSEATAAIAMTAYCGAEFLRSADFGTGV